jgi:hypothetical protein
MSCNASFIFISPTRHLKTLPVYNTLVIYAFLLNATPVYLIIGVEPMGLFWSLQPAPGQKEGLRFMKRNVRQPIVVHLGVLAGHWTSQIELEDHPRKMTGKTIYRRYAAPDVHTFDVRVGTLRGRLHLPPGKATR